MADQSDFADTNHRHGDPGVVQFQGFLFAPERKAAAQACEEG